VPLSAQGQPGLIGKSLKQAAELALFERDNQPAAHRQGRQGTPEGARRPPMSGQGRRPIDSGPSLQNRRPRSPIAHQAHVRHRLLHGPQVAGAASTSELPAAPRLRASSPTPPAGKAQVCRADPGRCVRQDRRPAFTEAVSRAGTVVALETYPPRPTACWNPCARSVRQSKLRAEGRRRCAVPAGRAENVELVARLLRRPKSTTEKIKLIGTAAWTIPTPVTMRGCRACIGARSRGWTDFSQKYAKTYGQRHRHSEPRPYRRELGNLRIGRRGRQRYAAAQLTRGGSPLDGAFRLLPDGSTTGRLPFSSAEIQRPRHRPGRPSPPAPSPSRARNLRAASVPSLR